LESFAAQTGMLQTYALLLNLDSYIGKQDIKHVFDVSHF